MPETSIIIRTFNEEKHINNLLQAIKNQDYKDYEIIIVDSGSTDRTLEIAKDNCDKILQIESRDFTFGYALNYGCKNSQGKYLVFASAHVVPVDKQWLSNLIEPLKNERVAMVYGRQIGGQESKFSERRDLKRLFKESPLDSNIFLDYANNANAAIRKELWQIRPFDEYLFGLEDIDWVKEMTKRGFLIHYQPKAAVYHIHQENWPQIFNRYRREAIAAARIGISHPPQARASFRWLVSNFLQDMVATLPNISLARLEEIIRFRYYQWKGTRQGWLFDKDIDLHREKYILFYPAANQAVVIKGKHWAELENLPLPSLKPGDILIKVDYVGVCRTDLEVYQGSLGYYQNGLAKYPIIPGHEFSGTIIQIGASNKYRERFKVGEKVIGECILSREDYKRQEVGVINYNGAYAQFIVIPGEYLHKIPKGMDLKTASLAEPLAVVLRAIRRLRDKLTPKSLIAVIGAGPIGNFSAQVLSLEGYKVTVFDKNKERLKFLGNKADKTSTTLDGLEKFDIIVEATGSREVLEQILKESRAGSTVLLLGFPYGRINYDFEDLVAHEEVILGSVGGEGEDFQKALELLPKLETAYFTGMVLPLKEFQKAWQLQQSGKYLKIILKP